MPLGLLAKDSIQDLEAFGRAESEHSSDSDDLKQKEGTSPAALDSEQFNSEAPAEGEVVVAVIDESLVAMGSGDGAGLDGNNSGSENGSNGEQAAPDTEGDGTLIPPQAANPQQAQEEVDLVVDSRGRPLVATTPATYGQYSGFRSDYYARGGDVHMDTGNYYHHSTYAPMIIGGSPEDDVGFFPKMINCIFPWLFRKDDQKRISSTFTSQTYEQETVDHSSGSASDPMHLVATAAATSTTATTNVNAKTGAISPTRSEDDEKSNDSDALGERLSAKERKAVLARLGLAQPDAETAPDDTAEKKQSKKGLLNGIPVYDTSPLLQNGAPKGILKRGSIADLSKKKLAQNSGSGTKAQEAGRRRSLFPASTYESSNKSSASTKNVIFSPMARVVTVKSKNELSVGEKGDVWWQKTDYEDFRRTGRIITKAMLAGGSEIWLNQSSSGAPKVDDTLDSVGVTGDKWWHKFGHSRRGLEHVVSMAEGRDRQINVRTAIRAVLDEQTRQKMYKREDPEKLRSVALAHTSWARDLALAAGSSDADAVRCAFAEDRKSREFYLLKMTRNDLSTANVGQRVVPNFMQPATHQVTLSGRLNGTQQHRLDANTAAQLSFRRQRLSVQATAASKPRPEESSEPIRDPDREDKTTESLAHRAAGFSVDGEKVDISAVLSGMGVVPQIPAATTVAS